MILRENQEINENTKCNSLLITFEFRSQVPSEITHLYFLSNLDRTHHILICPLGDENKCTKIMIG